MYLNDLDLVLVDPIWVYSKVYTFEVFSTQLGHLLFIRRFILNIQYNSNLKITIEPEFDWILEGIDFSIYLEKLDRDRVSERTNENRTNCLN